MITVLITLLSVAILAALVGFELVTSASHSEPELIACRPYKQYETTASIADRWHDMRLVGTCSRCGWDDSPIVVPTLSEMDDEKDMTEITNGMGVVLRTFGITVSPKCKWCAELDNVNYHLKSYTTRAKVRT